MQINPNYQDKGGDLNTALLVEMDRALRYRRPFSVLSIMADAHTENAGVAASLIAATHKRLRAVAPKVFRLPDFWGRSATCGIVVGLPETTRSDAEMAIERLVTHGAFSEFVDAMRHRALLRVGAAEWSKDIKDPAELIDAASKAARICKGLGDAA